ncbi:MAG: glycosyltransferase family 39 protein [Nitrospirae bacterium]|nr:glycosyltransferase family 39 protein [Nitrospirota bacterium]
MLLLLVCLARIVPGLTGHDPWKPDEAYSFGIVNHIFKSGDWVVPMLAGEPFMEKPPLYYVIAALFARAFSPWLPLHDAARLATGFFMASTLIFSGLAGREAWGKGHGRTTALILIGCLGLLIPSNLLVTDVSLLAGLSMAVFGLTLFPRRLTLAGVLIGTGTGIGFMSKGLIAPGMIGVTMLALPALRPWRNRRYLLAAIIAFAAALPWLAIWPYALYRRSPQLFLEWFWVNNFGRFLGFARLGPANEAGYYLKILPWFAWPALPLALWTAWRGGREALRQPAAQLAITTFLVMLTILSLASDGRELYALPMLLPLSILAASSADALPQGAARGLSRVSLGAFGLLSVVLWLGWIALVTGRPAFIAEPLRSLRPAYAPSVNLFHLAVALALTLSWLATVIRSASAGRVIHSWTMGLTLAWGLSMTLWLPWLDAAKSYRGMVASLRQAMPAQYRCVSSEGLGEPQRALLEYYAGIVTRREEVVSSLDCDLAILQGTPGQILELGPPWRLAWEGARPGDGKEKYRLYQR